MKDNTGSRLHLGQLRRKLFFKMLLPALVTALLCANFYAFMRGRTANAIVALLSRFSLDRDSATLFYQKLIRENLPFIIGVFLFAVCILTFLAVYWYLSSYLTRVFRQVDDGLRGLARGRDIPLSLPPELDFLQDRLEEGRTAMERQEEQALLNEQRKNDLVMYLAHDIKTPMTSVIGYLTLLSEAPDMPVAQRAKYTDITLQKAFRLEKLVDEFFEITRYDLHGITLDREKVDLYTLLAQMAEEFYPQLAPQNKQAQLAVPEDLWIVGDGDKLARVFNNLFKNAVAYSDPGTVISISAGRENALVRVVFENAGRTIPPHKLNTIFEKFYRLDGARSTGTGGAGLGLAIAKEIVLLHGGSIRAESEEGRTRFIVELPAGPLPEDIFPKS